MRRIAKLCCGWIFVMIMHCLLAVNASATEMAMFPMQYINISQGVNETYSHPGRLAIDICGKDTGKDAFYAPFTGTVKKIYGSDNVVWLESNSPVQFADGTVDYMTIMCMHDDDISDLYVGKVINQGDLFLTEGMAGTATGNHIHLECGKGKFSGSGWYENSYGKWCINNGVNPWDALYLSSDTIIYNDYGYNWRTVSASPSLGSPVDLGTDFFAYIINNNAWIPIAVQSNGNVALETETGEQNQMWKFTRLDDGSYKIISLKDGKSLDVHDFGTAAGTNVKVSTYSGNTAQQWYIYGSSNDYKLKAKCTDCVLDVSGGSLVNGANLQMYTYNNTNAQKFAIYKVTEVFALGKPKNIGTDFYAYISNTQSSKLLTNDSDNDVRMREKTGEENQIWKFTRLSDGSYKIISVKDNKALDVDNAGAAVETNIKVYNDWDTTAQKWFIYGEDNNYKLRAECTNCVIDVPGGGTTDGLSIQTYTYNDTGAQKFSITKTDYTPKSTISVELTQNTDNICEIKTEIKDLSTTATHIAVLYDKNGCVLEVLTFNGIENDTTIYTKFIKVADSDYVMIYLWDELNGMRPIALNKGVGLETAV